MRRSFTGPLLMIVIGGLFLWRTLHPETPVFDMMATYWPFLLIAWGFIRLIEVLIWHRDGVRGSFSGGEILLVILICVVGSGIWTAREHGARFVVGGLDWWGQQFDYPVSASAPGAGMKRVVFENSRGSIKVVGGDATEVTVNGHTILQLGTKVDPDRVHIKVDGKHLSSTQPYVYLLLNKPKNVMSTLNDPGGRPTVKDYLRGISVRVFPVGRLDFDSEGLMLLTNHGDLAQTLLHPRYHVPKTYLIKVKQVVTDEHIRQLEQGVQLADGLTSPAIVKKVKKAKQNSWLEMTIREGRQHQVKRMLEAVGHPVLRLTRVKMGPLSLGDLESGEFRYLTDREANALRELVEQKLVSTEDTEKQAPRPKRPVSRVGWARSKKAKVA
jgi:23S rRNA pseudouridine2605 synthase